jgi:hypothetical protein
MIVSMQRHNFWGQATRGLRCVWIHGAEWGAERGFSAYPARLSKRCWLRVRTGSGMIGR